MSKRANGEGSIYQRGDGRWVATVVDPATGKRRSAYRATEVEARRELRRMATRAERGDVVLAHGATLRTWVEAWLPERAGRRRRPSTVRAYEYRLTSYVLPSLGGLRLAEVTPLDVEDLAHELARRGLSRSTVKGSLVALAACLADAKRGRLIPSNPAAGAEVPEAAGRPRPVVPPTPDQVRAVVEACRGSEVEALVVLLATTGVRIGEALGARWSDLDLEAGTWEVSRTSTVDADGSAVVGQRTKAGDSRSLSLPPATVAALREQRRRVAELRLAAGPAWHDLDLLFPSPTGAVQHSSNVRAVFRPLAASVGWPGSFHSFRHYVASVGLSSLPTPVVSKVLGHRRASMTTDVYGHLLADDGAALGTLLSRLLSSVDEQQA